MFGTDYLDSLFGSLKKGNYNDDSGKVYSFDDIICALADFISPLLKKDNKLVFIGNGGSAAIVSHSVVDYWKNGRLKTMGFNDSSLITSLSMDYGYEHAFEKAFELYGESGDILFAISSSGSSKNIINTIHKARELNCSVITLSGFSPDNPLRRLGDYNCYIDSFEYGIVELAHHVIMHTVLDYFMDRYVK